MPTVSLCLPKVLIPGLAEGPIKRKKILSPEELEERRKKRQEAAAKRKRLMEERKKEKEEAEHRKKWVYIIPGWVGGSLLLVGASCVVSPQLTWF